jgi:hypothetical protein
MSKADQRILDNYGIVRDEFGDWWYSRPLRTINQFTLPDVFSHLANKTHNFKSPIDTFFLADDSNKRTYYVRVGLLLMFIGWSQENFDRFRSEVHYITSVKDDDDNLWAVCWVGR